MRRLLAVSAALALLVALAGAGYLAHLVGRLNTPEFQSALLDEARATLGADVRVRSMDISLRSGVTLEGVAVANPAPFPGDLLTADAFVLRYRLRPLLAGRVEVERLALEKPALALAMDARGAFNYEKLGRRSVAPAAPAAGAAAFPLRIVLKQLAVEDGSVVMLDHTGSRVLAVEDAGFRSAFEVASGVATGSGEARVALVNVADLLLVRDVRAPLRLSKEAVVLDPVRASVAGGEATGDVTVHLQGGFRYAARLEVRGARVETLLSEAKVTGGIAGVLEGRATFEGSGGLATLRGRGEAAVSGCRVEQGRVMGLLAAALQVPELARPDLEECRVEFTQSGRRLSTPVVSLRGEALRISGKGTMDVETGAIDYSLTLALAPRLLAKVTRPELRSAFRTGEDGFSAVDFRVYGTTLDPKTDLLARLGRAAAVGAAKGQLDRLLRKVF